MPRLRALRALLAAAAIAVPGVARAHDAEHTAVSFTFARDGTFVLNVANDPNWLLLRLQSFVAMEGGPADPSAAVTGRLSDVDRDARLRALAPLFIDRFVIWVDGHEVRPESAEYVPPPPQTPADSLQPLAAYRLRGRVAPDTRGMRWYYGMVADAYPLAVARADGRTQKEWIVAGDAWSRTLDPEGQFAASPLRVVVGEYAALGYQSVLPRGAGFVLFVLGLFLLRMEPAPIVRQVGAFTLAHCFALWLMALAVVLPPARVTGGVIALSVVYVVLENLATRDLKPWRIALVVLFGLAHGAALAGAFQARPAPPGERLAALAAFNLGVEGAQLTVLALATLGGLALHARAPLGRTS